MQVHGSKKQQEQVPDPFAEEAASMTEDDVAARALYERMGFTRHEGGPGGPVMFVYWPPSRWL